MSYIKSNPTTNYLQRNGFIMVSNLLIDYQEELGITDDELVFITKIMKNSSGWRLHDCDISKTVSSKTLQRRRKSLKEKGLLDYKTITITNSLGQKFNDGIMYDLSKLEEKLQSISDRIESEKINQIKQEIEDNGLEVSDDLVEEISETPLSKFQKDWYNYYGTKYELSKAERDEFNSLKPEIKNCFKYVFQYCIDKNLLSKITPRISLFLKTKFRLNDLISWCKDNAEIPVFNTSNKEEKVPADEENQEEEKELVDNNGLTEKDMNDIFEDLTGKKYMPAAKKVYRELTGELLTIGESYYDDIYTRIYAVLMANNVYDPDKTDAYLEQIKKEIEHASDSRDLWNNGEPVPELKFSSGIGLLEDEKKEKEDPVFGDLFINKVKEAKEDYNFRLAEESKKEINKLTEAEILKRFEENPEELEELLSSI